MAFAAAAIRVGSVYVNVTRLLVAFVVLGSAVFLFGEFSAVSRYHLLYFGASGLVGFAFGDTFLFRAFEMIGARRSMVIMSFAPAMAALMAYVFLDETLTPVGIIGMIVTLVGIGIVVLERTHETSMQKAPFVGVLWGFLGAIGQAGGATLSKAGFESGPIGEIQATFLRLAIAVTVVVPLNFMAGSYSHPIEKFRKERNGFYYTLLGATLGPILGVTFSLAAIRMTKVAIASTLMATTPLFMLPAVRLFHKEHLSWRAIGGAVLAVAGVVLLFVR